MPQTEPMTIHDLTLRIGKMFCEASKTDARKSVTMDEAIDRTDGLIAQRDRAILEAAAERVCGICPWKSNYCGKCMTKPAILAPLEKEEENADNQW